MRKSGILLHISSLPSPYGIGTIGKAAYEFIDFLKASGQSYWQILPVNPTAFGNSPYQSPSVFAGNPLLIDLEPLVKAYLLAEDDLDVPNYGYDPKKVNFDAVRDSREFLLRRAFLNFEKDEKYYQFERENAYWLDSYALFMAIKEDNDFLPWYEWDENLRHLPISYAYRDRLSSSIDFYKFGQYLFYSQWKELKQYAEKNGIKIIGDLPIYAALDSADVWANQSQFMIDADGKPVKVAGCPPDAFSEDGQLWGNPLYDWDAMRKSGYDWWIKRVNNCAKLFDVVRIDHFRGFEAFYAIPYGDTDAKAGNWIKGPGMDLFSVIKRNCNIEIIAEDLGFLTEEVYKLLDDCGFPGMKVLQFAFDPYNDNTYLLHHHPENSVVYTGTHDNDTCSGWFENEPNKEYIREYLNIKDDKDISQGMVRAALSSSSKLSIIPIQDFLEIPGRMNTPATLSEDNWSFRITKDALTDSASEKIRHLTQVYKRI